MTKIQEWKEEREKKKGRKEGGSKQKKVKNGKINTETRGRG